MIKLLAAKNLIIGLAVFLSFGWASGPQVQAQETATQVVVYFTGVGCPHCAKTDPVVLGKLLQDNPNLVVVEYEIYQLKENAPLLHQYQDKYGSGLGVPLLIFGKDDFLAGDRTILGNISDRLASFSGNPCPLPNGDLVAWDDLDLNTLPGKPKIWTRDRVLLRQDTAVGFEGEPLRELLTADSVLTALSSVTFEKTNPEALPLSGGELKFANAVKLGGWLLEWNGAGVGGAVSGSSESTTGKPTTTATAGDLTLAKILSLAVADSINPCALAVLTLMLITIMTRHPENRRKVLLAGLAFSASVFVMYLFYGLVIIRLFQVVQALTSVRIWLYRLLGFAAILLGALNLKDFFAYQPGGLGTEMPMGLRPRVQRLITGVVSPWGAVGVGAFVTIFLLPCTIGPYIICGGILCSLDLIKALPWLLLYNIIFVLPMLVITGICYAGLTTVGNVSGWKSRNIRYLHLVTGLLILGLGLAMVLGWI